ncbi:MAG: restriction endonuclease subunit S [Faecousia sp.]
MREMKDSGVEWIGEISQTWNTQSLKSIVKKHFGGCWGEEVKGNENDVLCIRIADFSFGNQSIKETASTMRNYTDAQIEKGLLLNNDLIVEKSGGGEKTPVGRVVIYNKNSFPERAMFANFSECIRLKDGCCARYIAYHLKALYFSFDMHYYFTQTTGLQNLDMQEYLSTVLCVPSLDEQNKIAVFLDRKCNDVDALISNVQNQIEKLKAYKQSLITEVVTKGLDPAVPLKKSGVEWLGEVPAHWGIYRIANLYAERSESGLPELPILTVSINTGVSDHEIADKDKDRVFIRMEDRSKYKRVCPGDLTYNMMRAWQGAFGAVRVDGLVSPAYVVAKPKNDIPLDSRYIEALLRTPVAIEEMHRYSRGIVDFRLRLYWPEFKNICICLPPIEEQHKIADYIDEIAAKVDALVAIKQAKIEKLEQYKRSLIYEYVTGKKEVC